MIKKTAISVMPATAFGRKNKNYISITFPKLMMTNTIYIFGHYHILHLEV